MQILNNNKGHITTRNSLKTNIIYTGKDINK